MVGGETLMRVLRVGGNHSWVVFTHCGGALYWWRKDNNIRLGPIYRKI